ncbi:hypothetical protein K438DRAFT_1954233 [Mycena galopus ATCC 62051]|nr:hypothetical protein K438DRAFT_1954233 [Mycena galopus ATCC 62051]
MSPISLVSVNLAAVVLESFHYGIYSILASYGLYLMVKRRHERLDNCGVGLPTRARYRSTLVSPVALGAFSLFITITSHWLLNTARLFIAFRPWEDSVDPQGFYSNLSHITEVLKSGFLVASILIGTRSSCIHHLWVVWASRIRIIIIPSITLMGFAVFGVGLTYQLSTFSSDDSIFEAAFRRWTTGVCFFSMCTAAYTTAFIWYKLWTTTRALKGMAHFGVNSLSTITRIFIDSATLITIWGLSHTVSYQCGSNIQFIAADCLSAIVGIANLLLQIRLHWDLTAAKQQSRSPTLRMTNQIRFVRNGVNPTSLYLEEITTNSVQRAVVEEVDIAPVSAGAPGFDIDLTLLPPCAA